MARQRRRRAVHERDSAETPADRLEIDGQITLDISTGVPGVDARAGQSPALVIEQVDQLQPECRAATREPEAIMATKVDPRAWRQKDEIVGGRRRAAAMLQGDVELQALQGRLPVRIGD